MTWLQQQRSGGYTSDGIDLFTTWSQLTALRSLGAMPANLHETLAALRRLGGRHGVGSDRGQRPDVWSSSYYMMISKQAGAEAPPGLARFIRSRAVGGAFTMSDNEGPSMWSSAFAGRALLEAGEELPDLPASIAWVADCQSPSGGLTWGPEWVALDAPDVRATQFGLRWIEAAGELPALFERIDREALITWVLGQQTADGGFRLTGRSRASDVWASADAMDVLGLLGLLGECRERVTAVLNFARSCFGDDGGARRSPQHATSNVWSTRNQLRLLALTGCDEQASTNEMIDFLHRCEIPGGGVGYRPAGDAGDAYTTAAVLLAGRAQNESAALRFLQELRLPEDGGLSYMPARGAEARATRFITAACSARCKPVESALIVDWATNARNPDGAWGIYEGRASATTTTCAVLGTFAANGAHTSVATADTAAWASAMWEEVLAQDDPDLAELAQLVRIGRWLDLAFDEELAREVFCSRSVAGGWRRHARTVPDLYTTYEVLLALQAMGHLDRWIESAAGWVGGLVRPSGDFAWTALSEVGGGAIATALGTLVLRSPAAPLPDLTL